MTTETPSTSTETADAPEGTGPDNTTAPAAETGDNDANTDTRAERRQHRDGERYRARLREVEAQRDVLADRVAAMQRGEAERLAAQHLQRGEDLWAAGIDLDWLLDENGDLVAELVDEAARDVKARRPHWGYSPAAPASQVTSDGKPSDAGAVTFTDAFKPRLD